MQLTKQQVKQLASLFRKNEVMNNLVEIVQEGKSGIGQNFYARYTTTDGEQHQLDITNYENW